MFASNRYNAAYDTIFKELKDAVIKNGFNLAKRCPGVNGNDFAITVNVEDLSRLAELVNKTTDVGASVYEKSEMDYIKNLIAALMSIRKSHACALMLYLSSCSAMPDEPKQILDEMYQHMADAWKDDALDLFNQNFGAHDAPYLDMATNPESVFEPELTQLGKLLTANSTMPLNWRC